MFVIRRLHAWEILDSRGRPTVKARCELADGASGSASVPSGASTGAAEAIELRDGDPRRYQGLGCRNAVAGVNSVIQNAAIGREGGFADQAEFDGMLLALDGTMNKSRLGANAILSASLAFARACASARRQPLYQRFAEILGGPSATLRPPRLTINLFSGGKHAGGQVEIQDVLIVPVSARTVDEALAVAFDVYQAAAALIRERYGMRMLRADEGGLAPPAPSAEALIADAVEAIADAGYEPGRDVCLAIDAASSHFHRNGQYEIGKAKHDSAGMIALLEDWLNAYPILSIEDGLAENDWNHWPALRQAIEPYALALGDDFLCTNPERIRRAIAAKAANALLLKVNQIGTLSEAAEACRLAKGAGWRVVVSARSGETEDDWLADLAVGWSGDFIKIGSITQSERLAKYNRLLEIETELELKLAANDPSLL